MGIMRSIFSIIISLQGDHLTSSGISITRQRMIRLIIQLVPFEKGPQNTIVLVFRFIRLMLVIVKSLILIQHYSRNRQFKTKDMVLLGVKDWKKLRRTCIYHGFVSKELSLILD